MKMTSSVGIAPNKMLSKICSEINKPDGLTYLLFDKKKIHEFMKERKIRDIPGIGSTMQ
jgi:nucleotidyltransferase/DNA polymerase involved in DNA repair